MPTIDISDIDITPYQTSPILPTEALMTLGNQLVVAMPPGAPDHVKRAAKRVGTTVAAIRAALLARVELAGAELGTEVAFDSACDRFWGSFLHRLQYWQNYALEGLDILSGQQKDKLDFEEKLEKAELARELEKHIFSKGRDFLTRPFPQQVALTASRLEFIATNEQSPLYPELIGADLLEALEVLQERYESMVHDRAMRTDSGADLRALRSALQRAITLYASAVISMLDEDVPESGELVVNCLRPMVRARVRRARSSQDAEVEGDDAELEAADPQAANADEPDQAAELEPADLAPVPELQDA